MEGEFHASIVTIIGLCILFSCLSVEAQEEGSKIAFRGGVGATVPLYDASIPSLPAEDGPGLALHLGGDYAVGRTLSVFVDVAIWQNSIDTSPLATYTNFSHEGQAGRAAHIGLLLHGTVEVTLYGFVGAGIARVTGEVTSVSETKLADGTGLSVTGGIGLQIPVRNSLQFYAEGRYLHPFINADANIVPIFVGIRYRP